MSRQKLCQQRDELLLLAAGAIPGALLRWRLELLSERTNPRLSELVGSDLVANLLGCLLIGALVAQPPGRARLFLWGGIGFCGSLTTFCSWLLEILRQLQRGQTLLALIVLTISLSASLLLTALGYELARRVRRRYSSSQPPGGKPATPRQ